MTLTLVLQTVAATAAWANGLFFLRFWRESHDALFACFGIAFWLLAGSWLLLASIGVHEEAHPYVFGLRLVAFALLIAGIVVKNRASRR